MKVLLLTTDTTHHRYFAWKLADRHPGLTILLESGGVKPRFDIRHPFEDERDAYEARALLAGAPAAMSAFGETRAFDSINDPAVPGAIRAARADVALVFGTRRIHPSTFAGGPAAVLNLHGGNPEEYRGLDTHLWAIYHEDFDNLVTTLHRLEPELDTGDIVGQAPVALERGMPLAQLRASNTKTCVALCLDALSRLASTGSVPGRKQLRKGRYYSFMPSVLKSECVLKFDRRVARL